LPRHRGVAAVRAYKKHAAAGTNMPLAGSWGVPMFWAQVLATLLQIEGRKWALMYVS
jgi:hypothetical protein